MPRCRIIYLLLSSFLFLSSCAYKKYQHLPIKAQEVITQQNLVPVIPAEGQAVKYKTSIDVFTKHFSGIVVLKQTEPGVEHLVFVTELGMRMFDFVIRGDSMHPDFVFEPLNKPKLVNALVNSFSDILLVNIYKRQASVKTLKGADFYLVNKGHSTFVIMKDAANFITENRSFSGRKKSSRTTYSNAYDEINYHTYGIVKLKVKLEKIKQ